MIKDEKEEDEDLEVKDFEDLEIVNGESPLSQTLIERAIEGKHTQFDLITNTVIYKEYRSFRKGVSKIATSFTKAAKLAHKDCLQHLKKVNKSPSIGEDENIALSALSAWRTLTKCSNYYIKETELVNDKIQEFEIYMFYGHWIDMLLLKKERPAKDLHDYRINPYGVEKEKDDDDSK